ncbi:MAG: hypothetical protein J0J04_07555 [Microbacterium sp.]|uniref:hypothetical protein n=1 Tax=Microbacterium sp. TaxID=51671 RepID=UPI001AC58DAC|nr:hypothetical protein [Microbacterium sp.]MBN9214653.1 hypothetical protein [Microbacterium sp.]
MSTPTTFNEAAHPRVASGRFTDKVNDAPSDALVAPTPPPIPASQFGSVSGTIVLQELDYRDQDIEVDRATVDVSTILDGLDFDDLPDSVDDYETIDELFHWGQNMGLIVEHGGPFEVHLDEDELEAYRAERERSGRTSAVTTLPTCTATERKERFNGTLLEQLPPGGISEVMAWDDVDAARWVGVTRTALVQQAAQGRVQVAFLDEDDSRMFDEINDAALAAYVTSRDTEKIRTTALHLFEHLARTQW